MRPAGGDPRETEQADADGLRRRAEEALEAQGAGPGEPLTGEQALKLVHELQVHRVELELQNEELQRTRREAEALRDRYADLYDFAPVGYFTLDAAGVIREANLTGSLLLSSDRQSLIGARFAAFIHPDGLPLFTAFCDRVRSSGVTETCDLPLSGPPGHRPWFAQLKGRAEPARDAAVARIRLVVSDVTARRRAEEELQASEARHEFIADVASLLLAADEPQAIVDDLCTRALDIIDGDVFLNYFADEASGRFVLNAYGGITAEEAGRVRLIDCSAAVCGCTVRDGCRVVAGAIPDNPDPAAALVARFGVRATACHPLVVAGEMIGTLSFGARSRDRFAAKELATMRTIADLIAIAMQRIADRDALRASEARLREANVVATSERDRVRNLLDIVGVMILALDSEGRVTLINRRGCEILGRPEEEVLGKNWVEQFIPERIRKDLDDAFRRVMGAEIEEFRRYENQVLTRDGEERDILWSNRLITDGGGRTIGILSSGEDVTERKRVEEKLRRAYEHNTTLLESIRDSFLALDTDWRFTYSNRRALGYSGKTSADVIGRSIWEVFPEILRTPLEAFYRTAMESREPLTYENPSVIATGRTFELHTYPTEEGGLSIFGTDVTERRRAEEALRESEERLRLAQESADVGVWDWDVRTGGLAHTPEFLRLYGLEENRITTYAEWRAYVHPDDAERVETERTAALARGEPFALEYRIVRPSGEVRWIAATGRGYCDESGMPVRMLGVNIDITDRKTAELALARSVAELQRSNEELQRFAYVASHDLQEPLRSIVSFSQLLERRYRGRLDQDADEFIGFIIDGGVRMQQLIRDLLQFSRVGTMAGPSVPTDPREAVSAALRLLETSLAETGATVTVGEMPAVTADPTQLEQVFANLVGNAVKYRRPGVPPAITISAHCVGPMVQFAVQDNGIGIEAEYFDRIFVIFQRLHTKDKYEGTGIGLAVVKKIVERHGGRVWVESTPGEGSTFFFTLPAA